MTDEIKEPDELKCSCCGVKNDTVIESTCPYAVEINDDERLCVCCAECRFECSMSI